MVSSDPPAEYPPRTCPECSGRVPFDPPEPGTTPQMWRCQQYRAHHTELVGVACRRCPDRAAKRFLTRDCALCRVCIVTVADCADGELGAIFEGWTPPFRGPLPDPDGQRLIQQQRLIRQHCVDVVKADPFRGRPA
jgi:hypothetical protein